MKHSILLVDDDELILNTLKKRFSTWDLDVFSANSPVVAREFLEVNIPEIIVLDLLLTKDDGSQAILDYIKSQERLMHVPVLVLTNLDKPELKNLLLSQGVKEYLIKGSISLDDLYEKVLGYLEPKAKV